MKALVILIITFTVLTVNFTRLERQELFTFKMPVIKPDSAVAFKILTMKPDTTKHFPMPIK